MNKTYSISLWFGNISAIYTVWYLRLIYFVLFRVTGGLSMGGTMYTMDRLPVHCRANTERPTVNAKSSRNLTRIWNAGRKPCRHRENDRENAGSTQKGLGPWCEATEVAVATATNYQWSFPYFYVTLFLLDNEVAAFKKGDWDVDGATSKLP